MEINIPKIYNKVKRKNSNIIWEVWCVDSNYISVMQYSSSKVQSRKVLINNFIKNWKIINGN